MIILFRLGGGASVVMDVNQNKLITNYAVQVGIGLGTWLLQSNKVFCMNIYRTVPI